MKWTDNTQHGRTRLTRKLTKAGQWCESMQMPIDISNHSFLDMHFALSQILADLVCLSSAHLQCLLSRPEQRAGLQGKTRRKCLCNGLPGWMGLFNPSYVDKSQRSQFGLCTKTLSYSWQNYKHPFLYVGHLPLLKEALEYTAPRCSSSPKSHMSN